MDVAGLDSAEIEGFEHHGSITSITRAAFLSLSCKKYITHVSYAIYAAGNLSLYFDS